MNKKQLLEAVELMRSVYSADEIHCMANEQYARRHYDAPSKESPLEEHIVWLATYNNSGAIEYAVRETLATHHSHAVMRAFYKIAVSNHLSMILVVVGAFATSGVITAAIVHFAK